MTATRFTYQRLVDKTTGSTAASALNMLTKEGITASDDSTVVFKLSRASADMYRPESLPKDFGLVSGALAGYRLSEPQAQKILEMQLQRLTHSHQMRMTAYALASSDQRLSLGTFRLLAVAASEWFARRQGSVAA